jgi:hypothetical protein
MSLGFEPGDRVGVDRSCTLPFSSALALLQLFVVHLIVKDHITMSSTHSSNNVGVCELRTAHMGSLLVTWAHSLVTWAHSLVTWAHSLVTWAHSLFTWAHSLVTWAHSLVTMCLA